MEADAVASGLLDVRKPDFQMLSAWTLTSNSRLHHHPTPWLALMLQ